MATYKEVQSTVKSTSGFVPKTCWIANVLSDYGMTTRQSSNRLHPNERQFPCPLDKRPAIEAALIQLKMIPVTPAEWLKTKEAGYRNLSNNERDAIMHFILLWSLFEARVMGTNANIGKIIDKVSQWKNEGKLSPELFKEHLGYFQARYFQNNEFTSNFAGLNFRNNDRQELVKSIINGSKNDIVEIVSGLLIIVYRLRNNLLHGMKWAYDISGQLDNFTNANQLLIKALDFHN